MRGVGPTLAQFNVPGVLSDPAIAVFSGRTRVAAHDNGRSEGLATGAELQNADRALGAFDLPYANEAALLVTLPAGAGTLHVRRAPG